MCIEEYLLFRLLGEVTRVVEESLNGLHGLYLDQHIIHGWAAVTKGP